MFWSLLVLRTPVILDKGPSSWPHFNSIFFKRLYPCNVTFWIYWGFGPQTVNLGGKQVSHNNCCVLSLGCWGDDRAWRPYDLSKQKQNSTGLWLWGSSPTWCLHAATSQPAVLILTKVIHRPCCPAHDMATCLVCILSLLQWLMLSLSHSLWSSYSPDKTPELVSDSHLCQAGQSQEFPWDTLPLWMSEGSTFLQSAMIKGSYFLSPLLFPMYLSAFIWIF